MTKRKAGWLDLRSLFLWLGGKPVAHRRMMYMLWLAGLLLLGGGFQYINDGTESEWDQDIENVPSVDMVDVNMPIGQIKITAGKTYGEFIKSARVMTPYLVGFLAGIEGFELEPYQDSRGLWTVGIGNRSTKYGRVGPNTPWMSPLGAYELARWHLEEKETYLLMYALMSEYNLSLTPGEFIGLASFAYNGGAQMFEPMRPENVANAKMAAENKASNAASKLRWTALNRLYKVRGNDLSHDDVAQIFQRYPILAPGRVLRALDDGVRGVELGNTLAWYLRVGDRIAPGLVWRRWMEANLIAGKINVSDVISCPIRGGYEFMQYADAIGAPLIKNRKINYNDAARFKKWVKNPVSYDRYTKKSSPIRYLKSIASVMPRRIAALYRPENIKHLDVDEKDMAFASQVRTDQSGRDA